VIAGPVQAVVVDLWETLVPLPAEVKRGAFEATAVALGLPADQLRGPWTATRRERETGDLTTYLTGLGRSLGLDWSPARLQDAVAARRAHHGWGFQHLLADAVPFLDEVQRRGLPLGLVSNCSSDVQDMIGGSALSGRFDVMALSAVVGWAKPDPRIFAHVTDGLGVPPEHCLYVGDGLDDELGGARRAGLRPVLVDRGGDVAWDGPRVAALTDLLTTDLFARPPAADARRNP